MNIIGGKHKKRKLIPPKGTQTRPTASQLREALFNICQQKIEGAHFLDLFAGSGAMGLEALSRGAAHATFVEKERLAIDAIKQNITALGEEEQTTLLAMNVFRALEKLTGPFDLIYVDPPYGKGLAAQVLEYIDMHPLLAPHGQLFLEDRDIEELPLTHLKKIKTRKVGKTLLAEYMRCE